MPISLTIELSDQDIQRLSQVAKSATHASDKASIETATAAASKLIDEASRGEVPKFVTERLEKLDRMIAMIRDEGWAMEGDDQQHVVSARFVSGLRLPTTDQAIRQLVTPLAVVQNQQHGPLGRSQRIDEIRQGVQRA